MYRRILLAYDGSIEGRTALREGALLAKRVGADAYLLAVVPVSAGARLAEGAQPGCLASLEERYREAFEEGAARLKELGFGRSARIVAGEPSEEIASYAREIGADLVVVGHRRQSVFGRWWSGASGANLSDHLDCTLLIGRKEITDEEWLAAMQNSAEPQPADQAS